MKNEWLEKHKDKVCRGRLCGILNDPSSKQRPVVCPLTGYVHWTNDRESEETSMEVRADFKC